MLFADARFGDQVDVSQLLEERLRDTGVRRIREALAARPHATQCQGCGDPIGAARLAAIPAATRCTDCQSILERKAR